MKNIKTMAFEINENSYSLAVAILPPVFATIPLDEVYKSVVVINELGVLWYGCGDAEQALALDSSWMSAEDFYENYDINITPIEIGFSEVGLKQSSGVS